MTNSLELIYQNIDPEELAELAVALGNIYSPPGEEKPVADYVEAWLKKEGFETRVLALVPERPNVVGTLRGSGGCSLLFNSHMDVVIAEPVFYRDPARAVLRTAWRDGDSIYGMGVVNDKGPLACFLCAAKAIKKAGITLKGDLVLTAVSGEIGCEPVDEFTGTPRYIGKEVGARFMVSHGGIADYALVAEATNFRLAYVEAGKAFFKITVTGGRSLYTPYINRPYPLEKHPNAIVQAAKLVERLEEWAVQYEQKHTYISPGGTLIPKVNIGALRGGAPYRPTVTPEVAQLYVDCRTVPNQDALAVKAEIEGIVRGLKLEARVDLYVFRRGYEAQNVQPLSEAIEKAHQTLFGEKPQPVIGPECSMWRDTNVFNEVGIPSATYGPAAGSGAHGNLCVSLEDFVKAAKAYAMIALDLCNRTKPV